MDRGTDKEHVVHIYSGICNLKEGNNAISRNVNGPRDYHTKKKSDRGIQILYGII